MATELNSHPIEAVVADETTIWRYMDLPKFVAMLATNWLWFAKSATFRDDPWEGFGKAQRYIAPLNDLVPKVVVHEEPDGKKTNISVPKMMEQWSHRSAEIFENAREHLYVNSWCLSASESMAMWHIYGSLGSGIAVKSTIAQYRQAARFDVDSTHYDFGKVRYHKSIETAPEIHADFRNSIPLQGQSLRREVIKLGFHKRFCYEYENEWRAVVYQDHRPDILGIHETFDLDQLISEVYVGPRDEGFVFDAVCSIMEKFSLHKPVRPSDLLRSPDRQPALPG